MGHQEINIFPGKILNFLGKKQFVIFPPKFFSKEKYSIGNQKEKHSLNILKPIIYILKLSDKIFFDSRGRCVKIKGLQD